MAVPMQCEICGMGRLRSAEMGRLRSSDRMSGRAVGDE